MTCESCEAERAKNAQLQSELRKKNEEIKQLKNNAASLQIRIEQEEECITNNLLKRLDVLKKQKEELATQVVKEEELMTSANSKLLRLRKEKVELENHLETEQEYIVNKLQKQLLDVTRRKHALERQLHEGKSGLLSSLQKSVGEVKETLKTGDESTVNTVLLLETQINSMSEEQKRAAADCAQYRQQCDSLVFRLEEMNKEHFIMQAKVQRFREKLEQVQNEREAEFAFEELKDERQFNERRRGSPNAVPYSALRSRSASDVSPSRFPSSFPDTRLRSSSFGEPSPLCLRNLSPISTKDVSTSPALRAAQAKASLSPLPFSPCSMPPNRGA